jgi:hypothetical protein
MYATYKSYFIPLLFIVVHNGHVIKNLFEIAIQSTPFIFASESIPACVGNDLLS